MYLVPVTNLMAINQIYDLEENDDAWYIIDAVLSGASAEETVTYMAQFLPVDINRRAQLMTLFWHLARNLRPRPGTYRQYVMHASVDGEPIITIVDPFTIGVKWI